MSKTISTGTSVTPRNEAKNIENVLVKASGLNRRPSWAVSVKTGMKLTVITRSAKNSERPTLFAAVIITLTRSRPVGSRPCSLRKCSSAVCAFSIMMIAESTIAPIAMAIPPNDMMLEVTFSHHIGMNERMIAIGSVMIATSDERTCQRKTMQTSATTTLSSISFSRNVAANQIAAVVNRHDAHTSRQRRLYLFNFLFYRIDDVECVFAVAHHDDAANNLTASVELGHTTPDVAAKVNVSNVLQVNRRPIFYFEDDVLDVLDAFDVAAAANIIF